MLGFSPSDLACSKAIFSISFPVLPATIASAWMSWSLFPSARAFFSPSGASTSPGFSTYAFSCTSVQRPRYLNPISQWSRSPCLMTFLLFSLRRPGIPASMSGARMLTLGWNQANKPRSLIFCLIHQATSSEVVTPGVITRLEKASAIMAWSISTRVS